MGPGAEVVGTVALHQHPVQGVHGKPVPFLVPEALEIASDDRMRLAEPSLEVQERLPESRVLETFDDGVIDFTVIEGAKEARVVDDGQMFELQAWNQPGLRWMRARSMAFAESAL